MDCYVTWNGAAWFAKEANFFERQKDSDPSDPWWKSWRKVLMVDGIEHARDRARLLWGERGERWVDLHEVQPPRTEINFNYRLDDKQIRTIIRTVKVEAGYRKALVEAGFEVGRSLPKPLPSLTDDMLRYGMGAIGTGSPEVAARLKAFWVAMRTTFDCEGHEVGYMRGGKTGWPPGLLQDDSRELSKWFASRPGARYLADINARDTGG